MDRRITDLPADLRLMAEKIVIRVKEILPVVVATEGLRHFEQSWDNQGFTDSNISKWSKRKPPKSGLKKWDSRNKGRAILVSHQSQTKGTHLKDSLRAEQNATEVIFSTDKAYAQVHNEGGKAGRGNGFIMEKREFMGESQVLNNKIAEKMDREIERISNNL